MHARSNAWEPPRLRRRRGTRRDLGARVPAPCAGSGGPGMRSPAHARGRTPRCADRVSSTPQQRASAWATANGACARMPKPPAPPREVAACRCEPPCCGASCGLRAQARSARSRSGMVVRRPEKTCRRPAVALAGAGPIRGRPEGGVAEVVLTGPAVRPQLPARERGPENAGAAAGLTRALGPQPRAADAQPRAASATLPTSATAPSRSGKRNRPTPTAASAAAGRHRRALRP
jgi:hypothetical protein